MARFGGASAPHQQHRLRTEPTIFDRACGREIKRKSRKKAEETRKKKEKSIFPPSETPHDFAPLFGEVGEKPATHGRTTATKRENNKTGLCTLQINSKVPARRGIVLECMLQQHTKRTQGKGKTPHASSWATASTMGPQRKACVMKALRQHAYSWASPSTKSTQPNKKIACKYHVS